MITTVPLLYGTYTVTKGTGTFTLEPPLDLNLRAGWPLYKEQPRLRAELHFAEARREATSNVGPPPVTGLEATGTPPPAQNELVRVEQAKPVEPVVAQSTGKNSKLTKATPPPKKGKLAKGQKPTPAPSVAPAQSPAVAVAQPSLAPPAPSVAKSPPAVAAATAAPAPSVAQAVAVATPATNAPPVPPNETSNALASTAGGGTWKTFPAGKMPLGRLIAPNDLKDLAEHGVAGERIYLKGQFVVNAADANHAVLRPRTRLATAMLHLGGSNTRIVVEFPAGYTPPTQGSVVTRDDARPLEITEVRKDEDGQLNVFAREIMQ
jgi:hypothetical protein